MDKLTVFSSLILYILSKSFGGEIVAKRRLKAYKDWLN